MKRTANANGIKTTLREVERGDRDYRHHYGEEIIQILRWIESRHDRVARAFKSHARLTTLMASETTNRTRNT